MELTKRYVTNNMHYKNNYIIDVRTLVLHSVGVQQPNPDVFVRQWDSTANKYLTQIVIGADKAYECLPCTSIKGKAVFCWHVGNANGYSIGAEMTEPSTIKYTSGANWIDLDPDKTKEHVYKTYKNAVNIFAQLCKFHGLNPLKDGVILSHSECNKRGIGTAHVDVEHIWDKFGLTMDQFRKDVNSEMSGIKIDFSESTKNESVTVNPNPPTNNLVSVSYDDISEGDILYFTGDKQYPASGSASGSKAKTSYIKVTKKYLKTAAHPIHARSVDSSGNYISGIYGWVDISDLKSVTKSNVPDVDKDPTPMKPYLIKVTADELNIRSGPGISYRVLGSIKDKGVYTIIEENNGWGKLKSKVGWISLYYTKEYR